MVDEEDSEMIMCPSFFKVYLPSHTSHHLRLPPAFLKNFNDEIPDEAALKDTNGNSWHIEIEEDENGASLKHGWEKFAIDHSLEFGDFLVFKYNGNCIFDVKVFGKNGCIKDQCLANSCTNKKLEMSLTPVKFEDELNEGQPPLKTIRSCKRKFTKESSRVSRKSKGSCNATQRQSRRITSGLSEIATATNPHFVASVNSRTPYYLEIHPKLEIPPKLVRENFLKLKPDMVFRTRDGKVWPVKVGTRRDGRCNFGAGWKGFWTENSIRLQDKCRFEFVFHKNRRLSKEILVTFLRTRTKK